jgi:hypothetical protein
MKSNRVKNFQNAANLCCVFLNRWSAVRLRPGPPFRFTETSALRHPRSCIASLLQLCVLRLGFLQNGDAGIGVLLEDEEVFVGYECAYAGGVDIRALRRLCLQSAGASNFRMRQCSCPTVPHHAAVVENVSKLGGGSAALSGCQVCLSSHINRIKAGNVVEEWNQP